MPTLCQRHLLVAAAIFSSRRMERASCRGIAVRFTAADLPPDHDVTAKFQAAFLRVPLLAREVGLLRLGTVPIDSARIDADACKMGSVRYDRACERRTKRAPRQKPPARPMQPSKRPTTPGRAAAASTLRRISEFWHRLSVGTTAGSMRTWKLSKPLYCSIGTRPAGGA